MKRCRCVVTFTLVLVSCLSMRSARAHKRGEEFSYLSMFLERDDNNAELDLDSLYRTYARAGLKEMSRKRRRLQHDPEKAEKRKPVFAGEPEKVGDMSISQVKDSANDDNLSDNRNQDDSSVDDDKSNDEDNNSSSKSRRGSTGDGKSDAAKKSNSRTSAGSGAAPEEVVIEDISPKILAKRHGEDIERLASMVSKLVKQYSMKSVIDVPCRAHAHWMPDVLKKVGPSIQYTCVDPSVRVLNSVKNRLEDQNLTSSRNIRYMSRKFWNEDLPKGDLVVSWAGLDNMDAAHVASFLRRVGTKGDRPKHKLLVVGTHSGSLQKSGDVDKIAKFTSFGTPINVRRPPFNLARPSRIIKQLSTGGNDKQMYVYFADKLFAKEKEE